jgi:hypothetical protein
MYLEWAACFSQLLIPMIFIHCTKVYNGLGADGAEKLADALGDVSGLRKLSLVSGDYVLVGMT